MKRLLLVHCVCAFHRLAGAGRQGYRQAHDSPGRLGNHTQSIARESAGKMADSVRNVNRIIEDRAAGQNPCKARFSPRRWKTAGAKMGPKTTWGRAP